MFARLVPRMVPLLLAAGCCPCEREPDAWDDEWALHLRLVPQGGQALEAGEYRIALSFDGTNVDVTCRVSGDTPGCDEVPVVGAGWELEPTALEGDAGLELRIRRFDEVRCGESLVGPPQLNVRVSRGSIALAERGVIPTYASRPGSDRECGLGDDATVTIPLEG